MLSLQVAPSQYNFMCLPQSKTRLAAKLDETGDWGWYGYTKTTHICMPLSSASLVHEQRSVDKQKFCQDEGR